MNKEKKSKELHDELPQLLVRVVNRWATKEKYLQAIKVDSMEDGYVQVDFVNKNHCGLPERSTTERP